MDKWVMIKRKVVIKKGEIMLIIIITNSGSSSSRSKIATCLRGNWETVVTSSESGISVGGNSRE